MALPALAVGASAIRSNLLERRALQALGESMSRTRTYAELETAMFDQSEVIWRYLSGLDPTARKEFRLTEQVVDYWQQRWAAELRPEELIAWAREAMANYKVPRAVEIVDRLPVNAAGKVEKEVLRARASEHGRTS